MALIPISSSLPHEALAELGSLIMWQCFLFSHFSLCLCLVLSVCLYTEYSSIRYCCSALQRIFSYPRFFFNQDRDRPVCTYYIIPFTFMEARSIEAYTYTSRTPLLLRAHRQHRHPCRHPIWFRLRRMSVRHPVDGI